MDRIFDMARILPTSRVKLAVWLRLHEPLDYSKFFPSSSAMNL